MWFAMSGQQKNLLFVVGLGLLIVLPFLTLAESQENLLNEIRNITSQFSSTISRRELSCNGLLYAISKTNLEDDDDCSIEPDSDTSMLLFLWPTANVVDKYTRCFCALSVFWLMVSTDLTENDTFCQSNNGTFACHSDCNAMAYFNVTALNSDNQCIVKANERHVERFKEGNSSIIVAFSGLSCSAIEFYREDICDVVYNPVSESTTTTTYENGTTQTTDEDLAGIISGSITLALIISLILIIVIITLIFCYINRKRKREIKNLKDFESVDSSSGFSTHHSLNNPVYAFSTTCSNDYSSTFMTEFRKQYESKLIVREDFKIVSELGQGAFGIVYKGVTTNGVEIAIKTLKDNPTSDETKEFMSEATVMAEFNHPNVMNLLGLCIGTDDSADTNTAATVRPMILLPYMVNGDLKSFLVSSRKDNGVETLPEHLSSRKLESMCLNIADGMQYLAGLKYVHRDLAARNCMVDEYLNVKVADFGFTRDIYGVEYYRLSRKTKLPVKWMSPESLLDNVYGEKTDVWSFGVTCWEVFSLGRAPYPGIDNSEIPDYIKRGNRLKKPFLCPTVIYSIILKCWNNDPNQRPLFSELVYIIENVNKGDDNNGGSHQYFQLDSVNAAGYEDFVSVQDSNAETSTAI